MGLFQYLTHMNNTKLCTFQTVNFMSILGFQRIKGTVLVQLSSASDKYTY